MSQRTIIFSSPEDVLNFVRTVEKYPLTIWIWKADAPL